jgi:formylglycine-generating enzyme required for sulfatase activity
MSKCLAGNSPGVFVGAMAVACCLLAIESRSDEQDKAGKATAEPAVGKEPGQVRDDNGLKIKLVWCPPGFVTMEQIEEIREPVPATEPTDENDSKNEPASKPVRLIQKVTPVKALVTIGYWLGRCEVTQSEWKQVMATEPWKGKVHAEEGDDFPAAWITWDEAIDFCSKLTDQERKADRLPDGWEYTLPTEAQWERACRARMETRFSFGDDESKLGEYAWFLDNASRVGEQFPHRVGLKKPNEWGLYDMHGNVWEWCRDWHAVRLPGGRDPLVIGKGQGKGSSRVFRGGSVIDVPVNCRSAIRSFNSPTFRVFGVGFRVALSSVRKPAAPEPRPEASEASEVFDVAETATAGSMIGTKVGQVRSDNGLKIKFVWCPPGKFKMGSSESEPRPKNEGPPVEVILATGFWLGKFEVTQRQWESVMNTTPWKGQDLVEEGADFAATCVNWDDSAKLCQKLTEIERKAGRLPEDWEYILPTEAQWEYACRAGTTTTYSFGDDASELSEYAWWGGADGGGNAWTERFAHEVGVMKANPWGLHDMHGNVQEWCLDFFNKKSEAGADAAGPSNSSQHVIRGGAWFGPPASMRSASRAPPAGVKRNKGRTNYTGFRLALCPTAGK